MTVRPVTGLKVRASLFFMPQSSWCEPLRKKPGAACGRSAWYRSPSLSASGMELLRPNFAWLTTGPDCHNGACYGDPAARASWRARARQPGAPSTQGRRDVATVHRGHIARRLELKSLVQKGLSHVVGRHLATQQIARHVRLLA